MPVNIGVNIQRSPNRINQQLREAGVEGKFPKLLLDFKDQYYLASGGSKTLANAVTHTRSGNAVMTDGYGPELVTNGDFSDGDTGWSTVSPSTISVSDGVAYINNTGTGYGFIKRSVTGLTAGVTYIFSFEVKLVASSSAFAAGAGESLSNGSAASWDLLRTDEEHTATSAWGRQYGFFIASDSDAEIGVRNYKGSAGQNFQVRNFSVQKAPVLKWAPHNLIPYSEDFTQTTYAKSDVTITANYGTAPDGTNTATRVQENGSNPYLLRSGMLDGYKKGIWARATSGTGTVNIGSYFSVTDALVTLTEEWQLIQRDVDHGESVGTTGTNLYCVDFRAGTLTDIMVWGAHSFRQDLGGMVDNPDQPASRASYVPTTSSAVYLPRIGHHVYNGSAWVNEGLLAESEARTNLLPYSSNFGNSAWTKLRGAVTSDDIVSPTGQQDGDKYVCNETSANGMAINDNVSISAGSDFAGSMYVKKGSTDFCCVICYDGTNGVRQWFNINDGTVLSNNSFGTGVSLIQATIEDAGNGWFRVSVSADTSTANSTSAYMSVYPSVPADLDFDCTATTTYGYIFGAQIEATATSSSYIPTDNNASVTRAAETFTIPSANLPWPSPNYIGSELVTNGDFSSSDDWIQHTTWNISGGVATHSATSGGGLSQAWTPTAGSVYEITFTITGATSGNAYYAFSSASGLVADQIKGVTRTTNGTYKEYLVADATTTYHGVWGTATFDGSVDNISVREINPLSVSIAMDGRMTYADIDAFDKPKMFRWYDSATDRIFHSLDTNNGTGEPKFVQEANNVFDAVQGDGSEYAPDVLVPFNMASRHGSTFLNGAVDGVALTEDTTPTELPDLSATDLSLAYDYMGTVGTFRVWDRDIGDTGIVEATNPSLEPSLSLTFEGTGTNSFIVNDWSE